MDDEQRASIPSTRGLLVALGCLALVRFTLEVTVEQGWAGDRVFRSIVSGANFLLGIGLMLLFIALIARLPSATSAGRWNRVLILLYAGVWALDGLAHLFGINDWVRAHGPSAATAIYAVSRLIMVALLIGIMVLAIRDLEERTNSQVAVQLRDREGTNEGA